ncbi:AI-2E family transporter [bacterium]|jgi:predicted PurR-regulated permease PerM|nr:AI-2E family transporter [bacterium]
MAKKIFAILSLLLFLYVAQSLLLPVFLGAILAIIFFPWQAKLELRKIPSSLASAGLTFFVTLVFLVPTALLIFLGTKAAAQQVRVWKAAPASGAVSGGTGSVVGFLMENPRVKGLLESLSKWFPISVEDLIASTEELIRNFSLKLAEFFGDLLTQIPGFAMGLAIMTISIYFFLVDGRRVLVLLRRNSIFTRAQTQQLIQSFGGLCKSVVLASVLSGMAQSFIYTVVAAFAGVPNVLLVGFSIFIASFVPVIGSGPITLGIALHQFLLVSKGTGIVLFITAGVVMVVDNFIRPIVLKGSANLHPLLAFLGAFGGLKVFGFAGVFVGPIIAGLMAVTLHYLFEGDHKHS